MSDAHSVRVWEFLLFFDNCTGCFVNAVQRSDSRSVVSVFLACCKHIIIIIFNTSLHSLLIHFLFQINVIVPSSTQHVFILVN